MPDDKRIIKVETGFKNILGKATKKIFVKHSKDVSYLKTLFNNTYEADILFTQRYIIDKIGEITPYPLKILSIDIETDTDKVVPDMKYPNQSITAIGMKDSFGGQETALVLRNKEWTDKQTKAIKGEIFDNEEDMLYAFMYKFNMYAPDIVTGWNVIDFDLQYILKRMKQFGINYRKLSPLDSVFIREKKDSNSVDIRIDGIIVLDMMQLYMYFRRLSNQGRAVSYSLDSVSLDVVGEGKIFHKQTYREMWRDSPEKLVEYNLKDVDLVLRINDKLKIIDYFNQIRCISCSQLDKIYYTTVLVDGLLLRRLHNKSCLPTKKKNPEDKYSGAFVIPPKAGIYNKVLALDVKGMYPNLIKTFNIGYETFNPYGDIKISEGLAFDKGIGIISETIRDLEKERNIYKQLKKDAKNPDERQMYDYRQYAVKVLMNSIYGYLGYPGSRLYKREVADIITTLGRNLIQWSVQKVEELNYKIIYGDTDSLYIKSKSNEVIDILMEGKYLAKYLNDSYILFAKQYKSDDCTLEIEFEKIFDKILFVAKSGQEEGAKKKYAYKLLWADGDVVANKTKFSGFDLKRSDSSKLSRDVQETILNMIMNETPKEDIVKYLKEIHQKMINGEIPMDDIGFPKGIKKNLEDYGKIKDDGKTKKVVGIPPAITGALYSNKYLGTNFGEGSKPKWIYVKDIPNNYPKTKVIAFENNIPDGFIVDYEILTKRIFIMKLAEIFRAADLGELPILHREGEQGLDKWVK